MPTKRILRLCDVKGCREPALTYSLERKSWFDKQEYAHLCQKHAEEWIKKGKL